MITDAAIRSLADRIAAEFRPQRIILFGSRAQGTARPDSDVDLLVVMPFEGSHIQQAARIHARVHPGTYAIDLLVRRPAEMRLHYEGGDPFVQDIVDHGRVLYEAAA